MANSGQIREHLRDTYVIPARHRGDYTLTARAADVARELNTHIPAVCGVLGSETLEREMRIERIAVDGPIPGGSMLFV